MSFTDDLLTILFDYHGGYKLMRQMLREPTRPRGRKLSYKEVKEMTLRNTLSRLKRQGLTVNKNGIWRITEAGKQYCHKKIFRSVRLEERLKMRKNMIIAFDVPEKEKYKRDWLRGELMSLGFILFQRSVWFGPAPVPQDFVKDTGDLGLLQYMKFFEVKEKEII